MLCALAAALRDWREHTGREPSTKILREAVWFYWQAPRLPRPLVASKYPRGVPWSDDAAALFLAGGSTAGKLVIEHLEPLNRTLGWLINEAPEAEEIVDGLPGRIECAVVTQEENKRLPDTGTSEERYRLAGLELDLLRTLDDRASNESR